LIIFCCSGWISHVKIWKIFPKNPKFSNFFFRIKEKSHNVGLKKYPCLRWVNTLFTAGKKSMLISGQSLSIICRPLAKNAAIVLILQKCRQFWDFITEHENFVLSLYTRDSLRKRNGKITKVWTDLQSFWSNMQRFNWKNRLRWIFGAFVKFEEVLPKIQRVGEICRSLANNEELCTKLQSFAKNAVI